jgi:protein-S-isoprenylcysteine O-methyltransferase Ste14
MAPLAGVCLTWGAWGVSWLAAGWWSSPTVSTPGAERELWARLPLLAGALLLSGFYPGAGSTDLPLWQVGAATGWLLVALAALGFILAWWARVHLGQLWSSRITRKADHRVVDSGPYALVRHPIYSGIILAGVATAALRGSAGACVGAGVMAFSWYLKAQLEEQFLRDELPGYDGYARRVPMLIPRLRV